VRALSQPSTEEHVNVVRSQHQALKDQLFCDLYSFLYINARGRTHARSHVSSPSPLALLSGSNNLESSVVVLLRCRSLLGNFVPSTATLAVIAGIWGRSTWHRVNDAFVGKLATANEFLGKATPIKCLRVCIDRIGENLGLGGK
jgi:hypothetical protein